MIQLSDKEIKELGRLGKCLRSYRADIDKMLAFLDELERRQLSADPPAGKGNRIPMKEHRKEKYKQKLRIK